MRVIRAPQRDMVRGLAKAPRVQLIGSMGLGKSGAILLHAGGLEMHYGTWPGMFILAPLQVAFNWCNEAPAWFPGKRVSLIAGAEDERKAALQRSSDIIVATYDHLPWLEKYAGTRSWEALGRLAVCDESTYIKKTRASWQTSTLGKRWLRTDGGVQTNALARHAQEFPHWVNATGTPTPNGLVDVWGQYWYIDGGKRLGNSYTDFEQRWFAVPTKRTDFAKPFPLPGAMETIAQLTADVTTVARVEDYYPDLAKPNVIDRIVELPAKARRIYREMKSRMQAQLRDEAAAGQVVTVQSAGAKQTKLLQIASGFAYYRDEDEDPDLQQCEELHTAKMDAIESILNETGEPLVVVYFFTASLHQMRKKFKGRLRELDDAGKAQDDWNAGKIEILALQYSSGSFGLSLQHGGRNICLLSPTYRGDHYGQVLERLGPLRQMQSGYNRVVNVFRIITAQTEDARVFDVPVGKLSAEQAMVEFMKDITV